MECQFLAVVLVQLADGQQLESHLILEQGDQGFGCLNREIVNVMQEDDVAAFLESHGYVLGNVRTETSPEKKGKVLEQDPVAGSTLDKESKVDIVVSDGKGKELGTVPSVTRISLDDAKKAIKSAGFEVGNISYNYDESIGKGYVIWQQYQAAAQLEKGTTIDLEVSSGPEPVPEAPAAEPAEGETEPAAAPAAEG